MKNIIIFLSVLFATAAGIEGLLKITRITPPTLKYYDPVYGSLNRPDIDYFKSTEGMFVGSTNYDGRFRETYPKRKQDKNTLRILLIGDSFVEGIDVFSTNHFAQYIENLLSPKLGRKVEVLNFGRGNCTLGASSYYFNTYISKEYDADIVLYFTEAHDIYHYPNSMGYPSTVYDLDSVNNIIATDNWRNSPEYKLHMKLHANPILKYYESSAYFRLFYRAYARIKINGIPLLTFGKFVGEPLEQNYSSTTTDDTVSLLSGKIYDSLANFNKGQVVFVVRNKPVAATSIIKFMKMNDYKFISLSDTFDDFYIKNTKINAYYFAASNSYGGHWNNMGHEAVGVFLANKLSKEIDNYKTQNFSK